MLPIYNLFLACQREHSGFLGFSMHTQPVRNASTAGFYMYTQPVRNNRAASYKATHMAPLSVDILRHLYVIWIPVF